jgi:hypothetical protein
MGDNWWIVLQSGAIIQGAARFQPLTNSTTGGIASGPILLFPLSVIDRRYILIYSLSNLALKTL